MPRLKPEDLEKISDRMRRVTLLGRAVVCGAVE